jgi:hypothetical protein
MPHPVLLVETTDPDGGDVLAHHVTELLGQAGVFVSVEVLGPNSPVGDYHRAAMQSSVVLGSFIPPASASPRGGANRPPGAVPPAVRAVAEPATPRVTLRCQPRAPLPRSPPTSLRAL